MRPYDRINAETWVIEAFWRAYGKPSGDPDDPIGRANVDTLQRIMPQLTRREVDELRCLFTTIALQRQTAEG